MLIEHEGRRPQVHPSAYVAPTAVLSGDVRVGPDCQVLFGAVLTDDRGPVVLDEATIVMENAVLRGTHAPRPTATRRPRAGRAPGLPGRGQR